MDSNFTNETNEVVETVDAEVVQTETVQDEVVNEQLNEVEAPKEQTGLSIASLVLGIVGLLAWCIPCCGYPVSITGLVMGIVGMKKGGKKMAIAGIILAAICLVFSLINSILGVALQDEFSQYLY